VQVLDLLGELRNRLGGAILLITHDFGVAARICDDIMVMYAGEIVETGPARQIFDNPRHPYTRALMQSSGAPARGERLSTIDGAPPDLGNLPPGCAFAARCSMAQARCLAESPRPREISPGHQAACWRSDEVPA